MVRFFFGLLLTLIAGVAYGQMLPSVLPNPNAPAGYSVQGFIQARGHIFTATDSFPAKFPTLIRHNNGRFYASPGGAGSYWTELGASFAIPTFQQTLTAGNILTKGDTINTAGNDFSIFHVNNPNDARILMSNTNKGIFLGGYDPVGKYNNIYINWSTGYMNLITRQLQLGSFGQGIMEVVPDAITPTSGVNLGSVGTGFRRYYGQRAFLDTGSISLYFRSPLIEDNNDKVLIYNNSSGHDATHPPWFAMLKNDGNVNGAMIGGDANGGATVYYNSFDGSGLTAVDHGVIDNNGQFEPYMRMRSGREHTLAFKPVQYTQSLYPFVAFTDSQLVPKYYVDALGNAGWKLNGNSSTSYGDFIGTTDNRSLKIKANNKLGIFIDSLTGNIHDNETLSNRTEWHKRTGVNQKIFSFNNGPGVQHSLGFNSEGALEYSGNLTSLNGIKAPTLDATSQLRVNGNNTPLYFVSVTDQFVMGQYNGDFYFRGASNLPSSGGNPIFRAKQNGSFYIDNKFFLNKDSLPITTGKTWALFQDTTTGQLVRQLSNPFDSTANANALALKANLTALVDTSTAINSRIKWVESATDLTYASTKNVGIGTAGVNRTLTVYKALVPTFQLINNSTGMGPDDGLLIQQNAANAIIENRENGYITFRTNAGNDRLHITAAGNIGANTITPNSTFQVNGSFSLPYTEKVANYTATASDYTINCTTGSFNVTLPSGTLSGRIYVVKNSGGGTITVLPSGTDTIDGATSVIINTATRAVNFQAKTTGGYIIIN